MGYQRLTREDRYQIAALKKSGLGVREIAEQLERAPSTISRELKRNGGWMGYDGQIAHDWAKARRKETLSGPPLKICGDLESRVREKLGLQWSPEQIAGRLQLEVGTSGVSYSSIYRYVYRDAKKGGELWKNLRTQRKKRKCQKASILAECLKIYENVRSISVRPKVVDKKSRLGDLERDLIVGSQFGAAVLTINDRVSKRVRLELIEKKNSHIVHEKTVKALSGVRYRHTLTNDHGTEFAQHKKTEEAIGVKVYFSHKGCAWERGANENTNGLLRQYFPRSMDFNSITPAQVKAAERLLNHRPRKALGYQTPLEVEKRLGQVLH